MTTTAVSLPIAGEGAPRDALGWGAVSRGTTTEAERDFVEYVEARQQALVRFAYLLTSDHHTAEDLVQTALAKTYITWDRLRDRGAVDSYVRRIIVNENTSMWRRAWKRRERTSDVLPDRGTVDADVETRDAVWGVVQSLPPRQRAAVVLRYYEDLSEADTAAVLGCSVGNVKSQTSRGLAAMRSAVTADPGLLGGRP
jgi:RNA polymerase sigma-70 factor (sigma-E family)